MAFRFRKQRRPFLLNLPSFPSVSRDEDEVLTGTVKDMQASAGEERLARALDRANIQYMFRLTIGAPRGMPGWKELDFLVMTKGLMYAVEVDTAFTHRGKASSDVLHDAIVLHDRELQSYGQLYPEVFHVDGETDLADKMNAQSYVRRQFGKG